MSDPSGNHVPMESFTEIAVVIATLIARAQGCGLESFSLDGVDTYINESGEETVKVQVSATLTPAHDEIPFEVSSLAHDGREEPAQRVAALVESDGA